GSGGFFAGLLHPFAIPAHALALVSLGLLLGQQGAGTGIAGLIALALALLAGTVAIARGVGETPANDILLAAAAVTGLLVVIAMKWPAPVSLLLAAVTGISVALDSPPEAITRYAAVLAQLATAFGAWIGVMLIAGLVADLTRDWQRIGVRVLGSWTAAIAI